MAKQLASNYMIRIFFHTIIVAKIALYPDYLLFYNNLSKEALDFAQHIVDIEFN